MEKERHRERETNTDRQTERDGDRLTEKVRGRHRN